VPRSLAGDCLDFQLLRKFKLDASHQLSFGVKGLQVDCGVASGWLCAFIRGRFYRAKMQLCQLSMSRAGDVFLM
jgi:hypothetical protein